LTRVGFFDCFSGASGDMVLGALISAGVSPDLLRDELKKLPFDGWELTATAAASGGLAGTRVKVSLLTPTYTERTLGDVLEILAKSTLAEPIRQRAGEVFTRLAEAEGEVHGVPADRVHFHDVGAIDAIVDVVGSVVGLNALGLDRIYASSLPVATGQVKSAHGPLPLPAPATLALMARAGAPTRAVVSDYELVTPTGAAILTTVAEFNQPNMTIDKTGVGLGGRDLPWPNMLRLWIGTGSESDLYAGEVTVIETNLDDSSPEQLSFAMERLFGAGALDVFFTPIHMKKNRSAVMLTVLASPAQADALARVILRETTSLGVRFGSAHRLMAPRRNDTLATTFGPIQVKIKRIEGEDIVAPEFEDCARIARERGVPISTVYAAVIRAAGA
jgi:pyridinium-3,5-bisthiocarboxylic acid mononucleotide nickel chelatase